jgi:hypothetical protein
MVTYITEVLYTTKNQEKDNINFQVETIILAHSEKIKDVDMEK